MNIRRPHHELKIAEKWSPAVPDGTGSGISFNRHLTHPNRRSSYVEIAGHGLLFFDYFMFICTHGNWLYSMEQLIWAWYQRMVILYSYTRTSRFGQLMAPLSNALLPCLGSSRYAYMVKEEQRDPAAWGSYENSNINGYDFKRSHYTFQK